MKIAKERVKDILEFGAGRIISPITDDEIRELARIALASLEAEPVAWRYRFVHTPKSEEHGSPFTTDWVLTHCEDDCNPSDCFERQPLYTAPPAPVENTGLQRKAAIHDALCEKYNVESLADFVDWQRNHIAELEAAPPAPVGEGETAVMPDYPGYVMTQRECYQAGAKRAVPEGWVAVPVELTGAMTNAMSDAILDDLHNVDVWRSVLAAAPQQEGKP